MPSKPIRERRLGSVQGWIAGQGDRITARQVLRFLPKEVEKIPLPLLRLLVDHFGDELPTYAICRERLEQET